MKAFVDNYLNKFISKKLTVFIISCVFVYTQKILSAEWVNIAMVYIGSQACVDMILQLRKK